MGGRNEKEKKISKFKSERRAEHFISTLTHTHTHLYGYNTFIPLGRRQFFFLKFNRSHKFDANDIRRRRRQ